jgi:preprotein translocase subunit SecF
MKIYILIILSLVSISLIGTIVHEIIKKQAIRAIISTMLLIIIVLALIFQCILL